MKPLQNVTVRKYYLDRGRHQDNKNEVVTKCHQLNEKNERVKKLLPN